jgi:hypothetical protein
MVASLYRYPTALVHGVPIILHRQHLLRQQYSRRGSMPPAAAGVAPPLMLGAGALAATACVSGPKVMVLWLPFTVIVMLRASVYGRLAATSRAAARPAHTALSFRPVAGLLLECMTPGYQGR